MNGVTTFRKYTDSWQDIETVITGRNPVLIWANYPEIAGKKVNATNAGYAFLFTDGGSVKYYESDDLDWDYTIPLTTIESPAMNLDIEIGIPSLSISEVVEPPAMEIDIEMVVPLVNAGAIVQSPAFNLDIEMGVPVIKVPLVIEPPAFNLDIKVGVPSITAEEILEIQSPAFLINIAMGISDIAIYQPHFTKKSIKPITSFVKQAKPVESFSKEAKPSGGWTKQPKP